MLRTKSTRNVYRRHLTSSTSAFYFCLRYENEDEILICFQFHLRFFVLVFSAAELLFMLGIYLLSRFPPLLFIRIQTNTIALQCSLITEYAIWQARGKQLRSILLLVYMQKILSLFRSDNSINPIKLAYDSTRRYFIDF